ncbi:hypothetical protein ACFE04_014977 [Oxalis oulophora]
MTLSPSRTTSASAGGRRSWGRPPGSRNKPKPPIIVTPDIPNMLKSNALQISSGCDILQTVTNYAIRRCHAVCILGATGAVVNVSLRQSPGDNNNNNNNNNVMTLQGRFEIISITGAVLPPPGVQGVGGLTVFLAGGQGQVLGGNVVGPLLACGPVVLMAASFGNVVYDRLPLAVGDEEEGEEEEEEEEDHEDELYDHDDGSSPVQVLEQAADEGAKSVDTYNAAVVALQESSKRVVLATKGDGKSIMMAYGRKSASGVNRASSVSCGEPGISNQPLTEDDMDKKIRELNNELECANRKCEVYRANLLSVLKDIEDHKLQLSIKVQNIRISLKDGV